MTFPQDRLDTRLVFPSGWPLVEKILLVLPRSSPDITLRTLLTTAFSDSFIAVPSFNKTWITISRYEINRELSAKSYSDFSPSWCDTFGFQHSTIQPSDLSLLIILSLPTENTMHSFSACVKHEIQVKKYFKTQSNEIFIHSPGTLCNFSNNVSSYIPSY